MLQRSVLYQHFRPFSSQSIPQQAPQQPADSVVASDEPVGHLTAQQQRELTAAVLSSFKASPRSSSDLLLKHLDDDSKRHLFSALEHAHEQHPQLLSRKAMADALPDSTSDPSEALPTAIVPAGPVTPASDAPAPTTAQLLRIAMTRGIPFVAFGFFDNMIMITAGEQIDLMFGAKLGLSSMAAAGLGNTVADVVGINISHTIEQKFKHMKSMAPQLTKAQMKLPAARRATWLGCAVGMATGCLLGLTPLLFFPQEQHHHAGGGHPTAATAAAAAASAAPG